MKKNLTIYIAIAIITLSLASTGFAQFGNILNKAKDAIDKKKDKNKKEEPKPTETPKPNESTNNDSSNNSGNGSSNSSQSKQETDPTSPLGKIYFSSQPFPASGGTDGSKTSFSSNEFIYGRLVLKGGTVREVLKPSPLNKEFTGNVIYLIFYQQKENDRIENGRLFILHETIVVSDADLEKTYLDFDVFPNPNKPKTSFVIGIADNRIEPANDMYHFLIDNNNDEGTYKLGIEILRKEVDFRGNEKPMDSWQKVLGEFSFKFSGTDYASIKSNYAQLTKNLLTAKLNDTAVPKEWTLKSSPLLPGPTEAGLKAAYFSWLGKPETRKFLKIYVAPATSRERPVAVNDLGIPKYRQLKQTITIFMRDIETNTCFSQGLYPIQWYAGGGTYGAYGMDLLSDTYTELSCEKLGVK